MTARPMVALVTGGSRGIGFDQITEADWDKMMAVNLRGPYFHVGARAQDRRGEKEGF